MDNVNNTDNVNTKYNVKHNRPYFVWLADPGGRAV
jgi:hypothetical protein